MLNQSKIQRAAKATDIVIDKAADASDALRIIFTNGYDVLSERGRLAHGCRLRRIKH